MRLEVKQTIDGQYIYLYHKFVDLKKIMTLFDHKKVLKVIDEIVKQFAKTGKFKDTFYLWERGRTHRLQLIKRSEYKLSEVEFEAESRKFDIFENLIKNLAKMNRN